MPKLNESHYASAPNIEIAKESPRLFTKEIVSNGEMRKLSSGSFEYTMEGPFNEQLVTYHGGTVPRYGEQDVIKQSMTPKDGELSEKIQEQGQDDYIYCCDDIYRMCTTVGLHYPCE